MLNYKFCKISEIEDADINKTLKLLSKSQFDYIQSLNEIKQKQSIAVRALLHRILTDCFNGLSVSSLNIDANGKPYLENSNLYISLTHSGDYVGCAVSNNTVGIDIEKIRPVNEKTVHRVCSESEKDAIKSYADFIGIWTLKEAYVKATGETNCKFSEISFSQDNFNIIINEIDGYMYSVLEII